MNGFRHAWAVLKVNLEFENASGHLFTLNFISIDLSPNHVPQNSTDDVQGQVTIAAESTGYHQSNEPSTEEANQPVAGDRQPTSGTATGEERPQQNVPDQLAMHENTTVPKVPYAGVEMVKCCTNYLMSTVLKELFAVVRGPSNQLEARERQPTNEPPAREEKPSDKPAQRNVKPAGKCVWLFFGLIMGPLP